MPELEEMTMEYRMRRLEDHLDRLVGAALTCKSDNTELEQEVLIWAKATLEIDNASGREV